MSAVVITLLEAVAQAGGTVKLLGSNLWLSAPRPLCETLISSLRKFKPELVAYLGRHKDKPSHGCNHGQNTRSPCAARQSNDDIVQDIYRLINAQCRIPGEQRKILQQIDKNIDALRNQYARRFGRSRGWNLGQTGFSPSALAKGIGQRSGRHRGGDWKYLDHSYWYWWNYRPAAVATHPYSVNDQYKEQAGQWAKERGLNVNYPSDFETWWYPRRTTLVVFTADYSLDC